MAARRKSAKNGAERREAPRIATANLRPIIVEVEEDGVMVAGALFPHDLSVSGVRGKWERPLPTRFTLQMDLGNEVVEVKARRAWQRKLPQGGVYAGVSFHEVSDTARARIAAYIEGLKAPTRRRAPRFADILPVEVMSGESSLTAIASDLSQDGLQITTDEPLPPSDEVLLLVPLTWDVPLELPAVIRWRRVTPHGGHLSGLALGPLSDDARRKLEQYMRGLASD